MTKTFSRLLLPILSGASVLAAAGAAPAFAPASAPRTAVITVHAGQPLGPVNPLIFGHNLEAADSRGIFEPASKPMSMNAGRTQRGQGFWDPQTRSSVPAVLEQMGKIKLGMLRYPGGCLAHNYNWKQTVGPLAQRPDWQFGLDEYIQVCRDLKAEPMITVTDYALPAAELPRHAAELVEYLNAPATPEHPWAMKRAAWGHPNPYGVKWFELGNESDHGNHDVVPGRRYSPDDYAAYAVATAAAMRAVDPSIKLGLVAVPGHESDQPWNHVVFKKVGPVADYVSIHLYGPPLDEGFPIDQNIQVAMTYAARTAACMDRFHQAVKTACGRDLPLAVTEYNTGYNHNWRFTFLAGLADAEILRLCLDPRNRIATANYWHILNDFWGIVNTGYTDRVVTRTAPVAFFETWARYCGDTVVESTVQAPLLTTPAVGGWGASSGTQALPRRVLPGTLDLGAFILKEFETPGVFATVSGKDGLMINFNQCGQPIYPNFAVVHRPATVPLSQAMLLKFSFEAKFTPAPGNTARGVMGLGLCDLRGWDATKSAIAVPGAQEARDWQSYEGYFETRPDCPGVTLVARLENPSGKLSGTMEYRNLKLQFFLPPSFPAFPGVTALATLSKDGKKLFLVVFNQDFQAPMTTRIRLDGFKTAGGSYVELYQKEVAETAYFTGTPGAVTVTDGAVVHTLSPHSMTAFEFTAAP
jgi:alpha-N-arabinofuranosidase